MPDAVDIEDIEAFIDGLKTSIDSLGNTDPTKSKGFQAQLAKTISALRMKKMSKIERQPEILGHYTKDDFKKLLLKQLDKMNNLLDSEEIQSSRHRKFDLVMKITKLRARISSL
jgi:hypothetical protein